ncbi:hypothetical protein Tco_1089784, partial [Tanacetum coccineum]
MRSCTKSSNEMIPCTMKGKPLVLSWGRTPQLDSDVSPILGFPNIPLVSITGTAHNRDLRTWARLADFSAVLRKRPLEAFRPPCFLRTIASWSGLSFGPLVDDFACLASFPWHTARNVTRDPAPAVADFSAQDYATLVADAAAEDVAPAQPRRQKKRKTIIADAGGPSHPPKKLREDHGTPSGPSVAGKSRSVVQRLFAGAVLNAEVRGEPIPTLPVVTSSVSATPEHEGEDHTDSVTGLNLQTIYAPKRFVISSDSSHYSGPNIAEAEVDSFA